METFTSIDQLLAASLFISHRLQDSLTPDSFLLLHRSQWRCLAKSYSAVLHSLSEFLEHTLSLLEFWGPPEEARMCHILSRTLYALFLAVREGEKCMHESLRPSNCSSTHSWLVDKALPQGMSTDVVDIHLHNLLWIFSVACQEISGFALSDTELSIISHLAIDLLAIWECVDSVDDFHIAQSLLNKLKEEEGSETYNSQLADFVLKKLGRHVEGVNHSTTLDDAANNLPSFLWVDPESLLRNPDTLGEGGYGKVYEARWLGGHFAVKDFFYVQNNEIFGREAAIQAQLCHPNVIPLVCCTKSPSLNKCSLVMELMHQDLQVFMMQRMEAGMDPPFSLIVAVDLMLQMAKGMEYLHSLRIIHRDLKSSNILVSFSSRTVGVGSSLNITDLHVLLKVADFGMSKAKHASSRYTSRQRGTTPWRAPEVFEANPEDEVPQPNSKYTNKADVYSFALVCYEILTGKPPFEGPHIRRRVLGGERPRLPHFCAPALSSFIEACWHPEPTWRPSFTQICRMLRYFKACLFLEDVHKIYNHNPAHHDWLLRRISSTMSTHIDDRVQRLAPRLRSDLRCPQSDVILIPLVMYCCREISQVYTDDAEASSTINEEISSSGVPTTETGPELQIQNILESQRNDVVFEGSRRLVSKGNFVIRRLKRLICQGFEGSRWSVSKGNFVSRWLKSLICLKTNENDSLIASSDEFRNAVGLWGGFTYSELCAATNNFSASSLIGRGRSGEVYHGTLVDGRQIAVKRKFPSVSVAEPPLQELRIASQLRHRNIVPLIGWCRETSTRGELILVYEYMPNGDLAQHIFGEGVIVVQWWRRYIIVCQLAAALKYLHQDSGYRQIVHRDVKPHNVFLDSEWNARLGDCGTSLLLEGHDDYEPLAGTLGYLAPESLLTGVSVSPAVDIFAFGMTVFEIVTGRSVMQRFDDLRWLNEWVRRKLCREMRQPASLVDVGLAGVFDEEEAERLLLLGMACTYEEPEARPDIEEVLRILSKQDLPPPPQCEQQDLPPPPQCEQQEYISPTQEYISSSSSMSGSLSGR